MDTRSRKRRRAKRNNTNTERGNEQSDSEAFTSQNVANIPVCHQVETNTPSKASLVASSQSTSCMPRHSNSCSRIALGRSPSPARLFRQREQSELQTLNTRLSSHAEHVKQLQAENGLLKLKLETMEDVIKRETSNIKQVHGSEIKSLQDLLDACYEERNKLELERDQLQNEKERLVDLMQEKEEEIASLCSQLDALKTMSTTHNKLKLDYGNVCTDLKESKEDVKRLSAELLKAKRSNRRLEEEAKVNKNRYLKEVEEASARFNEHIHKADQQLEEGYETLVTDALASVREQHMRDLEGLRAELTNAYQSKLTDWKAKCEVAEADLLALRREVKVSRQEQDRLCDSTTLLKAEKAALEVKLSETQTRLYELKEAAERDRCQAQREVALLRQELSEVREELEEMGGANSRLETEINAYRVIVEDLEEQTPPIENPKKKKGNRPGVFDESLQAFGTPTTGRKKRKKKETADVKSRSRFRDMERWELSSKKDFIRTNEFSRGIDIVDFDVGGKYVTLINSTDHPTDLCLWTIQQTDDSGNQVRYEISSSTHLPRGKRLIIWSRDEGPSGDDGDDGDEDDRRDINCDDEDGINLTMRDGSWLQLDQHLAIRVEDGDGQLQAKCDVNSIGDKGLTSTKRARLLPGDRSNHQDDENHDNRNDIPMSSSSPKPSACQRNSSNASDISLSVSATKVVTSTNGVLSGSRSQRAETFQDKDNCLIM